MVYRVEIPEKLEKTLKKVPKNDREKILQKIDQLSVNPRPDGCKKLQGSRVLYRVRAGDYRVIYNIKDQVLLVLVVQLGHRKEIYKN